MCVIVFAALCGPLSLLRPSLRAMCGLAAGPRAYRREPRQDETEYEASPAVADVLGSAGCYRDPLWRITVELSDLEQQLLPTEGLLTG
ncbi:hypothetical protein GCM10009676_43950 [Prauserella halophila]|uniref:Uncharacterized protein n=1 Tax=Prauserella halophila TaxID=185641 RepID=A0ABN1WJB8_9PSEU